MKKWQHRLLSVILMLVMMVTTVMSVPVQTSAASTVKVRGTYYQSDARKMKKMINKFRTGDEAWYYQADGSDKKVRVEGLKKLSYDYALEKVAMKRAAEISVLWSHTRPNGKDCFSAYPDGYMAMGENIAMGTASIMSTAETMEMWKETDQPYSGQGHRRNMLGANFTCVGIACIEVDGNKYWVQEFGSPNSGAPETKACNKKKTVRVRV